LTLLTTIHLAVPNDADAFWSSAGKMTAARAYHTATKLLNGKVLIAGDTSINAELYDPATNTWGSAGTMAELRASHSATLLADGKVLVVGGFSPDTIISDPDTGDSVPAGPSKSSAEVYDPATNSWTVASSMSVGRANHTAARLPDGRVLVSGGQSPNYYNYSNTSEIYDPESNVWTPADSMEVTRAYHTATVLSDGKVLVAGGQHTCSWTADCYVGSSELYDPSSDTWSATGDMVNGSYSHRAVLKSDGNVMVVDGFLATGTVHTETYDKSTGNWTAFKQMSTKRLLASATDMGNGSILVAGGMVGQPTSGYSFLSIRVSGTSAEKYNQTADSWQNTGNMIEGRYNHTATLLSNGKILVTGGISRLNGINSNRLSSAELYDPNPAAPVASATTNVTQTGFTVNWGAVTDASGYYLDVATDSGFVNFVGDLGNKDIGNCTTYTIGGLSPGTVYYYRLRAYSTGVVSSSSTAGFQLTVPATPVASAATSVTASGLVANWEMVNSATGYFLAVSPDSGFATAVSSYSVGNVTSYTLSGLTMTTYYYRVWAYNSAGLTPGSNAVSATLPRPPVAPVSSGASGITQTGFVANWQAVPDSTGYKIDVSANSAFTTFVAGYSNKDLGITLSSTISGLSSGTTYYYRVRAYNSYGTGSNSNVTSGATYPAIPPKPVAYSAIKVSKTAFTVNWPSSNGGATGYVLDLSTSSAFTGFVDGYNNLDVGNVLAYDITGLTPGTRYYYRLRSYNALGTFSANSDTYWQDSLSETPAAGTAASISNTGFTAVWNNVGATGYYLDVASDVNFTSFVPGYSSLLLGNVSSYSVTGLSPTRTYYYRVRGYVMGAVTPYSNVISLTTLPTRPSAPNASSATLVTCSGFTANWLPSGSATGYNLDLSTNSAFTNLVPGYYNLDLGNVTSASISGLNPSATYYYRVRARNSGGSSDNSNVIVLSTTSDSVPPVLSTFTLPSSVVGLSVPISDLTATDNVAVTGYLITDSDAKPSAAAGGWSAAAPAAYLFPSTTPGGSHSLFAWCKDASGNVSSSKSAAVTIIPDTRTLSVTLAGTGHGSLNSDQPGLVCSGDTCSAHLVTGTALNLFATPDAVSTFAGWSGSCSGATCSITMTANQDVTANFILAPKAMIDSTGYTSLSLAYAAASSTDSTVTIHLLNDELTETVLINLPKSVFLKGGYEPDYNIKSATPTRIKGALLISRGKLTVEGISLK
jgi:N-acetylneuraminic acid mutarotase/phosphodiesterase/alkaline phosphatase D-like protein